MSKGPKSKNLPKTNVISVVGGDRRDNSTGASASGAVRGRGGHEHARGAQGHPRTAQGWQSRTRPLRGQKEKVLPLLRRHVTFS